MCAKFIKTYELYLGVTLFFFAVTLSLKSAGLFVWRNEYLQAFMQKGLIGLTSEIGLCRGAVKSLDRPGKKQTTATEDFEFHISYL